ncbi:MAG: NAD-dependent epimerase/dehydratase family protein [Gemmatimonadaceae bacterium]
MPRALVTGATGLVGSYVTERLVRDGWDVRALVRDPSRAGAMAGVEIVAGDVLDSESFTRAAASCNVVFHTAAAVTAAGGWEAFRRPNIDGTTHAIEAAERASARLVHVSSVAVYGGSSRYAGDARTDEDTRFAPLDDSAFYARSKRDSEALVMEAHRAGRVWATALRPDVIYGRRDRQFVPRMARLLGRGFSPLIGGGQSTLAIVHAENVADGVVRAASHDAAGGRAFNLANDYDVSVAEFFRLAGEGMGRRLRVIDVPPSLAKVAMRAFGVVAPLFFGSTFNAVTNASLDFMTRDNPFTSERARRELGWDPRVRPEVGVPDAFRWSMEHQ